MPCLNEEKMIASSIESLVDDFVMENAELLVVDGMSTDKTVEQVGKFIERGFPIRILINENRLQCFGMNRAIREGVGENIKYIIRVDAHSTYPPGYVKRLVELLETTDAINAGGIMVPVGKTPVQQAVAFAMQHPVGVGDAKFHTGNYKGYVDTVYLGAFKKQAFDNVGLFDTNCRTNEDAELNIRLLNAGEKIYLDSSISVEYLPRETFKKLAIQYFRYGIGRAYTTMKHKRFTSYRQPAPVLLVIALLASLVTGFFYPLVFLFPGIYTGTVFATGLLSWRKRDIPVTIRLLMSIAFIVMHISWGAGFLCYFLRCK